MNDVQVKDGVDSETVEAVKALSGTYKYGWNTEIEMEYAPKGLSEDIVRLISEKIMNQNGCWTGACRRTNGGSSLKSPIGQW
jgi:hypothetical protein